MDQTSLEQKISHSKNFLADEQKEREDYLKIVVYFVLFVTGALTLSHFVQKIPDTPWIIGTYFLITLFATKGESRHKYYDFWSWFIILGAILVINLTLIYAQGINAPGLVWFIIIAAFCEILFKGNEKFIPISIIVLSIVLSKVALEKNWLPESVMNSSQVHNLRMLSTILAASFMFFFTNIVRSNLRSKRAEASSLSWKTMAYTSIFDFSDDMIGMADNEGNVVFQNKAFVDIVGIDPEQENVKVKDFHPEWAGKKVMEEAIPYAKVYGSWTGETAVLTKDGKEIPTLQTIITNVDGEDQITSTIIKDISILKEREEKLKKEIEARHQAEKEAEKASNEKSLFLANMSHEIRTPLNSIIGLSEILLETNQNEEDSRTLKTLNNAGNHLLAIVNDILDISKIQAGLLELEERILSPQKETSDLVDIFEFNAKEKNLKLMLESKLDGQEIFKGDKTRIRQIIGNLINNAIKFTSTGHVIVEVEKTDNQAIWRVRDTGVGIEEENLDKIFSQFKQESAATNRRFGGTGLGLSISKRLAEMMGGTLTVSSVLHQGTTFELIVPVEWKSFKEITSEKTSSTTEPVTTKDSYSILCVDDSEDNTFIVEKFLEKTHFKVTVVHSGAEAISLFETKKFDLILMDSQMPGFDGNEATKRIREIESRNNQDKTIIVAFSASATNEEIDIAMKAGHDSYLTKPVTKEKLLTCLKENLYTQK
jgi:PAS domain S-box-containing protein